MKIIKKLLILILFPILTLSLFISIGGTALRLNLLDPNIYKDILSEANFYETIETQIRAGGVSENVIPSNIIIPTVSSIIDNFISYLKNDTETLNLNIEVGDSVKVFFEEKVKELPICESGVNPFVSEDAKCRPPNMPISEFLDKALEHQGVDVSQFEGPVNLAEVWDPDNNASTLKEKLNIFKKVILASWAFSILLILIIYILSTSLLSALFTISLSIILSGIILITPDILFPKIITQLLPIEISASIYGPLIKSALSNILEKLTFTGYISIFIGLIGSVVSKFFINKK